LSNDLERFPHAKVHNSKKQPRKRKKEYIGERGGGGKGRIDKRVPKRSFLGKKSKVSINMSFTKFNDLGLLCRGEGKTA